MVPLKYVSFSVPQKVTLTGNKVTADLISQGEVILEKGGPIMQREWCLYKRRRETGRQDTHVTTEVEIRVTQLQARAGNEEELTGVFLIEVYSAT